MSAPTDRPDWMRFLSPPPKFFKLHLEYMDSSGKEQSREYRFNIEGVVKFIETLPFGIAERIDEGHGKS